MKKRLCCLLLQSLYAIAPGPAWADSKCESIPPVPTLDLESPYSDAKGSIHDEEHLKRNQEKSAAVDAFLVSVGKAIDSPSAHPGNPISDCAFENFKAWAEAER
jgi:hypothetical protein